MRNELRLSLILIALICFIVYSNKPKAADVYIHGGIGVPHLQFQFQYGPQYGYPYGIPPQLYVYPNYQRPRYIDRRGLEYHQQRRYNRNPSCVYHRGHYHCD